MDQETRAVHERRTLFAEEIIRIERNAFLFCFFYRFFFFLFPFFFNRYTLVMEHEFDCNVI